MSFHCRLIYLLLLYFRFVHGVLYYGLSLSSGEFGGSIYLNFTLTSLVEMPAHVLSIDNCNRWAGVNGALTSECPSRRDRYPFGQRYSLSTGFIFSFHSFRFGRKKSIIAYLTTAGLSVVAISFIPAGTENTGNEETISALIMATYRGEGVAKSINKKSKKKYAHRRWGGEHVKRWGMLVVSLRTVNHGFGLTQLTFFGVKLLTTQENYLKEQNSKLFKRCLAFYASTL